MEILFCAFHYLFLGSYFSSLDDGMNILTFFSHYLWENPATGLSEFFSIVLRLTGLIMPLGTHNRVCVHIHTLTHQYSERDMSNLCAGGGNEERIGPPTHLVTQGFIYMGNLSPQIPNWRFSPDQIHNLTDDRKVFLKLRKIPKSLMEDKSGNPKHANCLWVLVSLSPQVWPVCSRNDCQYSMLTELQLASSLFLMESRCWVLQMLGVSGCDFDHLINIVLFSAGLFCWEPVYKHRNSKEIKKMSQLEAWRYSVVSFGGG